MKKIIRTNQDLCIGCNRCVRECPIEMANIVYQDKSGNIKVKVDHSKCIACGRCISACTHGARYYTDDTVRFFADLQKGEKISLIVAPAVVTNIPEYRRLFAYLKSRGVDKIFDASLGGDICVWAHIRHLQNTQSQNTQNQNKQTLITQPCPSVVSYCELYRHDLVDNLSPIHSPMVCTAIYMKNNAGITGKIAALSPCIAKANEFESTGKIEYNVTFAKLLAYLTDNGIALPDEESDFDHAAAGLGGIFPMPGGLRQNVEYFLGKSVRIDEDSGAKIYRNLDTYAAADKKDLPQIYDVLNCEDGCNDGSGCTKTGNIFGFGCKMEKRRTDTLQKHDMAHFQNLYKQYDNKLCLSDFMRKYCPADTPIKQITDEDIQKAFKRLDKDTPEKQRLDCGACGSDTCYGMARRVALKINIPLNCVIKTRDHARKEHEKNLKVYKKNLKYTDMIKDALQKFETIWTNVESGILIIDAETRKVVDINGVALRVYGDEKKNIIGRVCHDVICMAERKACPIMDKNQIIDRSERKFKKANGEVIPVIKSVSKITYNGRPSLLESFVDITHIKQAEERLRLLNITEQANRAKSEFLSKMSHEMRTPMNAILGMTKIAENTNDIDRLKYCLSTIGTSSQHLLGIINDVLDMSKIEAGKFELSSAPFNLEKMLMKVCNLLIEKIEQKRIDFKVLLGKGMSLHFNGDEMRLSQVVMNLMSNAVKFTGEGGKIELGVEEIESGGDYSVLRFKVTDSGIGMTDEQISRLFNPFEQADSSTTRNYGGTGLGLAISKSIVEKMGGSIRVQSTMGKGSCFIFEIKLDRESRTGNTRLFGNISPSEINVLVVDSDAETRDYFLAIVGKFGLQSKAAGNTRQAIQLLRQARETNKPFDVIFVDCDLPDSNGESVIRQFKEQTDGNTVIVMTTFTQWYKMESAVMDMGVSRFISKPLFPSSILDSINEIIGSMSQKSKVQSEITQQMPDFSGLNALLVEDIAINREIFLTLFENSKMNVDEAENGRRAVDMFVQNPDKYDVILMDMQMPVMDGCDATREIRAHSHPRAKTIPIIAMTANAFKDDIEKCKECGMNDHLAKPIDIDAVNEKIAFYCKGKTKI